MFNGLSFHGKKDFIVIHKVVKIVLFRENKKKCYRKLFDVKNHRVFWIDRFVWKREASEDSFFSQCLLE